jgi:hypothetical protein
MILKSIQRPHFEKNFLPISTRIKKEALFYSTFFVSFNGKAMALVPHFHVGTIDGH